MTVVDSNDEAFYGEKETCSVCKGKLGFPHVAWNADLAFCTECCRKLKTRLQLDFIECVAIADMRDVAEPWGYRPTSTRQIRNISSDRPRSNNRTGVLFLDEANRR